MPQNHRRPADVQADQHNEFLSTVGPSRIVAYLDETFQRPTKQFPDGFYSISAVLIQGQHIRPMQENLRHIVDGDYWHATEALRDGKTPTFLDILDHMRSHPTLNLFVTTKEVNDPSDQALHDARAEVLSHLMIDLSRSHPAFYAVIAEQQNTRAKSNADEKLIRDLRNSGQIRPNIAYRAASPAVDRNLWLADTAAMTYRRTLTHSPKNETSHWFGDYLAKFSHVTTIGEDNNHDPRVLPRLTERMMDIQNNPDAPERSSQPIADQGPLAFLMQQNAAVPLAQQIERQLQREAAGPSANTTDGDVYEPPSLDDSPTL